MVIQEEACETRRKLENKQAKTKVAKKGNNGTLMQTKFVQRKRNNTKEDKRKRHKI